MGAVGTAIKLLKKLQPKVEITPQQKSETDQDIEMKSKDNSDNKTKAYTTETAESKSSEIKKPKIVKPSIRESWYQSDTNISFILNAKNMNEKDISITYTEQSVVIELKLKNGTSYTRNIELFANIAPEKCSYSMNKYKITVVLVPASGGKWESLERVLDDGKEHSMISGPWNSKKDWNKVDEYATKELEKERPEGDEALQSLFSKIYGDADDDAKRAMMKSFQTSGGTVLSTNWKDVKDKDYEGKDKVSPTGQDVEKWEY